MRVNILIRYLFIAGIGLASCNKKTDIREVYDLQTDSVNAWTDRINVGDTIIAGWSKNMTYRDIDKHLILFYDTLLIDVNEDGSNDLEFFRRQFLSSNPLPENYALLTARCLNEEIELATREYPDTSYIYRDTTFSSDGSIHYVHNTLTCQFQGSPDSTIKSPVIRTFSSSESLFAYDGFLSERFYLRQKPVSYDYDTLGSNFDIYNDCQLLPTDEVFYFGFVLHENEQDRLGWIEVVRPDNNYDQMYVLSFAIQENE